MPSMRFPTAEVCRPSLMQQLGGWAFRQRSWLPVPLALVLVFVRAGQSDSAWVFYAGAALVLAGLAIRLWAPRDDHGLGRRGPPRGTCRSPTVVVPFP